MLLPVFDMLALHPPRRLPPTQPSMLAYFCKPRFAMKFIKCEIMNNEIPYLHSSYTCFVTFHSPYMFLHLPMTRNASYKHKPSSSTIFTFIFVSANPFSETWDGSSIANHSVEYFYTPKQLYLPHDSLRTPGGGHWALVGRRAPMPQTRASSSSAHSPPTYSPHSKPPGFYMHSIFSLLLCGVLFRCKNAQ